MNKILLDSNIFVYSFDMREPEKRDTARRILDALGDQAVISAQVIIECFNVLTRKVVPRWTRKDAYAALSKMAASLEVIPADAELVRSAMNLSARYELSIWDAMIVAAALRAGVKEVYSEDLAGAEYAGVRIVDPFTDPQVAQRLAKP